MMFNAILRYVFELEFNAENMSERNIFNIKKEALYAIKQVRLELRIPIFFVLFLMTTAWVFFRFFWILFLCV